MFLPSCHLGFVLLIAGAGCQQPEVGEMESGKSSSSGLAEFVDNLIGQNEDVKESREREAKWTGVEVEEVEMMEEEKLPSWKVRAKR